MAESQTMRQSRARLRRLGCAAMLAVLGAPNTAGTIAHAAPVTDVVAGFSYVADDADIAAGATVVDYAPGALEINFDHYVSLHGTGYYVTGVDDGVFKNQGVTNVFLPFTITTIGAEAFAQNNLTTVTIPAAVTSIGEGAFDENPNLREIFMLGDAPVVAPGSCPFGDPGAGPAITVFHQPGAAGFDANWNRCGYTLSDTDWHTVTFNTQYVVGNPIGSGVTPVPTQGVTHGHTVALPAAPHSFLLPHLAFVYWYITNPSGKLEIWHGNEPVVTDLTVTAHFGPNPGAPTAARAPFAPAPRPTTPPATPAPTAPPTVTAPPAKIAPPTQAAPRGPAVAGSKSMGQQSSSGAGAQLAHTGTEAPYGMVLLGGAAALVLAGGALFLGMRRSKNRVTVRG